MSFTTDHRQKFDALRYYLDANNRQQIRLKGNGGNSILFTYPPAEERQYLQEARRRLEETVGFVEVNRLLVNYIDSIGWKDFERFYRDYQATPHQVFKSDDEEPDLFSMIVDALAEIDAKGKTPALIRTGCLYGTGIENVNIMEHPRILKFRNPLIIFYPSTVDSRQILHFLWIKPPSKYLCVSIE
jgi:hypothetical protein